MALALGSIASKYTSHNDLTAADLAYIEEFRNANEESNVEQSSSSSSANLKNPYQANFRKQKQQILQQNLLLKRFRQRTRLKRCLLWMMALSIVTTISAIVVFVFARYVRPEHYVQFFAILISLLAFVFISIVLVTHLAKHFQQQTTGNPNETIMPNDHHEQT